MVPSLPWLQTCSWQWEAEQLLAAQGNSCGVCYGNLHEFFSPANALSLAWCTQDIDFSLRKKRFFLDSKGATATKTVPEVGQPGLWALLQAKISFSISWTNDQIDNLEKAKPWNDSAISFTQFWHDHIRVSPVWDTRESKIPGRQSKL